MMARRYRSVNKALTLRRIGLIALALLVVAGAAVGITMLLNKKDTLGTLTAMPFAPGAQYALSGSGIYYVDGDKLRYVDILDPETTREMTLGTSDVNLVSGAGLTALYSGAAVHIVGASEMIDAGGAVEAVRCGSSIVAVLRRDVAGMEAALVYTADGFRLDEISGDGAVLLDAGIAASSGGELLYTLELDTSASEPVSTLTTYAYPLDGSAATVSGVTVIQSELVERVLFTDGGIFLCGTEHLMRRERSGSGESWRLLTYGYTLKDVSRSGSKLLFAYAPRGEAALSAVKLYSVSDAGESDAAVRTVRLRDGVHTAIAASGRLYAFAAEGVYVYDAKGKLAATYTEGFAFDSAVKLSETRILVSAGGAAYVLTVQ